MKDTAIHLFAEKGYHLTTIQEIASRCGISKGGFYKHFHSKENLLIEMVTDSHRFLFQKVQNKQQFASLSPREVLESRIQIELEQMRENSSIYLILFKEFPPNENSAVSSMMANFRFELMEWHKQCLLEAFGESAQSMVWDLVVIYEGIVKEYISLIIFHQANVPISRLATLVVHSLEAVTGAIDGLNPVVEKEMLFQEESVKNRILKKNRLAEVFHDLRLKITSLSISFEEKQKLDSALQHLQESCLAPQPEAYLLEALVKYLKSEQELKNFMEEAEGLIRHLYGVRGEHT